MRRRRVLLACEMSARVRDEFAGRGWEAWSADLLPSESPDHVYQYASGHPGGSAHHYIGDCRDLFKWAHPVNHERLNDRILNDMSLPLWDLVIAFPPCTHLSQAGAVHWKKKRLPRFDEDGNELPSVQDEAADFFMAMTKAPAPYVAVENPRGDMTRRWRAPDQYVQPYMFGDRLTKLTGIWVKDLPLLVADNLVEPEPGARVATGGGSYKVDKKKTGKANNGHEDGEGRARRDIVRSRTLPGLARAMADQWGPWVERETE